MPYTAHLDTFPRDSLPPKDQWPDLLFRLPGLQYPERLNCAAALLVYGAAWTKDQGAARITREAAMAKLHATEAAQGVIDKAVQIHGGAGVTKGVKVEELYREIRALRIYEGATEVQKIVIAREALKARAGKAALAAE